MNEIHEAYHLVNIFLPTVGALAAAFSAIAAFLAWRVAHNTLSFQKSSMKNKTEIEIISDLVENLLILKTIRQLKPLELPDDQFLSIDNLLSDIENLTSNLCSRNDAFKNKVRNSITATKNGTSLLYRLLNSSNPWEGILQGGKDTIDDEIEYLKSIRNGLL